jgi:protein-disulfide isomerase
MKFQEGLGNLLAAVAVTCAIATTGLLVRREFFLEDRRPPSREPILVKDFQEYIVGGHRIGPPNAAVTIVEFSDFQCPFCKWFADSTWPVVAKRFPTDVALIYRQFPLPMHKNAYAAARASECAGEQGRFAAFHDLIFKKQDSLGIKPYSEYAAEAGVPSVSAFDACNSKVDKVSAIETDLAMARRLGLHATPTIMVNDKRFPTNPTTDELVALIEKELKKRH